MRRKDWVETEGVVGGVQLRAGNDSRAYSVVFTYKVDGHFYGGTFTSYMQYQVGDTLPVSYDPSDPDRNDLVLKETIAHWVLGGIAALVIVGYVVAQFVK